MSEFFPSPNNLQMSAHDFYEQAEGVFAQGNLDAAISLYQRSIELNPNFSWSYHRLGDAFSQQEKWEEAVFAYQRSIELNPNFSWSYYNLGNALAALGQFAGAIPAYSRAIFLDPNFSWSYYKLGVALRQEGRRDEAISAYFQAIKHELDSPEVYIFFAEEVRRYFSEKSAEFKFLKIARDDGEVCLKIAKNLAKNSDLKAATIFYNLALKIQPENVEARAGLNQIQQRKNRLEQELNLCYRATKSYPHSHEAYYKLGVILSQQQRWDEAILAYLKAIELQPETPTWAYQGLWKVLTEWGQLEAAESIYRRAVEQNPHSIWRYVNLGEILTQKGQLDEALLCYQAACYQKIQQFYPGWMQHLEKLESVSRPDFIIIGTQKGGTTSLYYYLVKHPKIMPSLIKEIDFWSTKYHRGLGWYLAHFPPILAGQTILTGEATPSYLDSRETAGRLAQTFPQMKLIIVLRNPVDRAVSHYYQWVNMNWEFRSLEEAMISEIERLSGPNISYWNQPNSYIARGVYVEFLKAWLEVFPKDQILIISSETFYSNPAVSLKEIFNFLGLPDHPLKEYKKYNARSYPNLSLSVRNLLKSYFHSHNGELEDLLGMKLNWND